jgi:hypothetical protein
MPIINFDCHNLSSEHVTVLAEDFMVELQWREKSTDKWEPQADFKTREDANDFIAEQPLGGMYRIVEISPAFVDVSTITEYGLTQKLSNSIRVF